MAKTTPRKGGYQVEILKVAQDNIVKQPKINIAMKTNESLSRQEIDLIERALNLLPNDLREKIDQKRMTSERIGDIFGFNNNPVTEKQEEDQVFELYQDIYHIKNKLTLLLCNQEITTEVEFFEN